MAQMNTPIRFLWVYQTNDNEPPTGCLQVYIKTWWIIITGERIYPENQSLMVLLC